MTEPFGPSIWQKNSACLAAPVYLQSTKIHACSVDGLHMSRTLGLFFFVLFLDVLAILFLFYLDLLYFSNFLLTVLFRWVRYLFYCIGPVVKSNYTK